MSIQDIKAEYESYTQMYDAGEISPAEYKDLLEGLKVSEAIAEGAEELEEQAELNKMVTAAIDAASLLA